MAKEFTSIEAAHRAFILRQHIFFTASAAASGHINLSPKGLDSLRLIGSNKVVYLDLTGSGNETAAHLLADGRLTLMFCAFEGPPLILRLYGHGRCLRRGSAEYTEILTAEFAAIEPLAARQMILLDVTRVQTSCGYGVPFLTFTGDRPGLNDWAEAKGESGLETYRRANNLVSFDGFPTGLLDETQTAE